MVVWYMVAAYVIASMPRIKAVAETQTPLSNTSTLLSGICKKQNVETIRTDAMLKVSSQLSSKLRDDA